mmetsp:Transcript_49300/g.81841  ORF Transcript_49300/g.81841 Transcript_49300/m.81841 type:complete len:104 (-) Transcript_49300:208-519(-)
MSETTIERLRRQWREATGVRTFPLGSWMLAGSCLVILALTERYYIGPLRKQQEAAGAAPSISIFGDISVSQRTTNTASRVLPCGATLMADGSVRKAPDQANKT